ncbi:fungal-specific transcription factor domain-containing protein [Lipomyces orientalis]|uniref:Fungal-specific transcription factor domain-containing protein n=1 Tax=Lipomyces orientalis TaxID=1233043 RepID=A0ACC3TXZ4_9ASCO
MSAKMETKIRFVVDGALDQFEDLVRAGGDNLSNIVHRQKRVSRACTTCKLKKIRCSGTQPCAVCSARKIECAYKDKRVLANPPAKRHKRSTSVSTASSTVSPSPDESTKPSSGLHVMTWTGGSSSPTSHTHLVRDSLPGGSDTIVSNKIQDAIEPRKPGRLIRQPYFRWLGPTSVAPPVSGSFRLLSVNVSTSGAGNPGLSVTPSNNVVVGRHEFTRTPAADDPDTDFAASTPTTDAPTRSPSPGVDPKHSTVNRRRWKVAVPSRETIDTFYEHMASFLPFLRRKDLDDRISDGVAGECLLYSMAAIAERLKPSLPGSNSDELSELYAEQAKMLLIPHLALPSVETVFALLLIAYHEFGEDRDSGLWSWSGLAIRMSYDLGLHKGSDGIGDEEQIAQRRRVFWSVVCLDRFISCGTGRVATILTEHIEHEVGHLTTGELIQVIDGKPLTDPFPYLCRLVLLLGKVSDTLNQYAGHKQRRMSTSSELSNGSDPAADNDIQSALEGFQKEISDFHASLPADLVFDVHNFQAFARTKHAQCFLLMHTWNHAIILAVYHPKLVYPRSSVDIPGWLSNPNSDLTRTSAISIADIIAFADLIAPNAFLSNPFTSQPLLMAASASLTLWHSLTLAAPNSHHAAAATVHRAFSACQDGLKRLQRRWKGVSWLCQVLDSLEKFEPDVDLTRVSGPKIKTKDMGFIKRASIDGATRQWIADELGGESFLGVVIAGMTTETTGHNTPASIKQEQKVSHQAIIPSTSSSLLRFDSSVARQYGVYSDISPSLIPQEQQLGLPDGSPLCWGADDPFKSLLAGSMSLDEFLGQ